MHDYFPNYIIRNFILAYGLYNPEVFFSNACPDYIIWKLLYGGGIRRLKMYFQVVYGMTEEPMEVQEETVLKKL